MATRAIDATVTGRVQGVGYRFATQRIARALDVHGWVRNLPDGTVEVRAQGESSAVADLVSFLNTGPFGAQVRSVDSTDRPIDPSLTGFEVRH